MKTTWLGNVFDWLGETFERFNPSAFRFLAAVLPYLTPFPVAWLTAHSASDFLDFTPTVAFIFVFALEGIGLWFTSLLVDAVVDWIRSRNIKTFSLVGIFALVVFVYISILVTLNVTLEASVGNSNPSLSKVITLLCYLPLLTGIGNGYYKLKLEGRRYQELSKREETLLAEKIRQENRQDRMERYKIKHGNLPSPSQTFQQVSGNFPHQEETFQKLSSDWRKVSSNLPDELVSFIANNEPKEIVPELSKYGIELSPRSASNWCSYAKEEEIKRGLK